MCHRLGLRIRQPRWCSVGRTTRYYVRDRHVPLDHCHDPRHQPGRLYAALKREPQPHERSRRSSRKQV
ncbi:hypothetical protein F441_12177 [Phytophthora nicotianae CJ01A1]|uniref:Uncharacterized protein n=2 Tax=Phytophthora nicotianae TaxID=4792 RepID=W2GKE9_PHYNI|nr:hypothetical protein L915_11920 [Phytophthora nicotianae]ETL36146.1 hypothetical protein L916_11849 [Phytophthora nicotianae]ETP12474.1 hypothetical protein F441_12177 [Phytophthora nicotianae CJ01A1]